MSVKTKVDDQIFDLIDKLPSYEDGSEEKAAVLKQLSELHKLRAEEIRLILESEKEEKEEKNKKIDRWIKGGLELIAVVGPLVLYRICFNDGLEYERDGTIGSFTVRNLIGKGKL